MVGNLKKPRFAVFISAGKSSPLIAKQLAFYQICGNSAAVYTDKRFFIAAALAVDILSKYFFADACFAADHHRCIKRGDLICHTNNGKRYLICGNKIGFIEKMGSDMLQFFMKAQPLLVSGFYFLPQMVDFSHIPNVSYYHFDFIAGAEYRRTGNERLPPRAELLLQRYWFACLNSD